MVGCRGMMRDRMMGSRMRNIGCRGIGVMVGSRGIRIMVRGGAVVGGYRGVTVWCRGGGVTISSVVVNDGVWGGSRGRGNQCGNDLKYRI